MFFGGVAREIKQGNLAIVGELMTESCVRDYSLFRRSCLRDVGHSTANRFFIAYNRCEQLIVVEIRKSFPPTCRVVPAPLE